MYYNVQGWWDWYRYVCAFINTKYSKANFFSDLSDAGYSLIPLTISITWYNKSH